MDPGDYPPGLEWERPIWDLFLKLQTQRRPNGGLDYSPAILLIERRGWDLDFCLDLLRVIETTLMKAEDHE